MPVMQSAKGKWMVFVSGAAVILYRLLPAARNAKAGERLVN